MLVVDVPKENSVEERKTREIETQTQYRDSETQTDPYSPEFIIPESLTERPEVVLLAEMGISYSNFQHLC